MWASQGGGERLKCEAGGARVGGGTSHDAGRTQSRARAGTRHAQADARVLVLLPPSALCTATRSALLFSSLTLPTPCSPGPPPLLGGPPCRLPKLLTILRRMDSPDKVGPPGRRPSWTGALGATLGRILGPGEEHDDEDERTLADGASVASTTKGLKGMMVVGKKEGE